MDHEEIRRWAEARGGKPATVTRTEGAHGEPGILRIDFPGYSGGGSLEEITWEQFFKKFEESKLALVYQEETADGERSNFNKLGERARRGRYWGLCNFFLMVERTLAWLSPLPSAGRPLRAPRRHL